MCRYAVQRTPHARLRARNYRRGGTVTITTSRPAPLDIDALRSRFSGWVIGPADPDYDAERTVLPGGIDSHPAVIVRVAGTDDVREVIALARETGHELAVRAGGHSAAAHSTVEG